jgi:hypothetical protein
MMTARQHAGMHHQTAHEINAHGALRQAQGALSLLTGA